MSPGAALYAVHALAAKHAVHRELRPGVGRAAGDDATCGGCGYHVCACAAKVPARKPPAASFEPGDRVRVTDPECADCGTEWSVGNEGVVSLVRYDMSTMFVILDNGGSAWWYAHRFELVEPAPVPRATAG